MPDIDLNQFAHVRRMRDPRFTEEVAAILPGEFFVTREPMVIYTVLGSCVSACIRDPIAGIGGMNHFMLPAPKGGGGTDSWGESTRYGSFAMERLINEILKLGGMKHRLEIKLFGGGKIYDGSIDVGVNNARWVLQFMKQEGYIPAKTDLGDVFPRKVYYFAQSGRVLMKKITKVKNDTIFAREAEYQKQLQVETDATDVTLF
ncbi:putative chemoreceptor glutamine deamidase CheD [Nitrospira sp.]|nr:putative chemoreceptor glutamine deamidase CheD [Nitrospira sp.]